MNTLIDGSLAYMQIIECPSFSSIGYSYKNIISIFLYPPGVFTLTMVSSPFMIVSDSF
jgi:hypothetical protein